ncbi:hypothetical protein FQN57_000524 [Myotisia sp. PD_48]|nr:hypothetical protein FQN57_000524 [Myotisia sp. PD_48]
MSKRLGQMAEDAMIEGGNSARKNMREAGFSSELKQKLEEKIAASTFRNDNASAIAFANLPRSAGKGTQDIAAAAPWTGNESIHDASLRMLNDASKTMRVPFRPPQPGPVVTLPKPNKRASTGQRLSDARQRTAEYTLTNDPRMSADERESFRKELQDRFGPGVHSFPVSIQGFNSLANQRIEDAMARGQFKNIPRGRGKNVEHDHLASSAYVDTTEYLMNRILRNQETAPEWIQKQQEMKLEISRFRAQLRNDWTRHAVNLITGQGGTKETQLKQAAGYAAAEYKHNKLLQGRPCPDTGLERATESLPCLRDSQYMAIERKYHELKIKKLNELIRSYNLQAPPVAQKPYLNLERELDSCYADTSSTLVERIKNRGTTSSSTLKNNQNDRNYSGESSWNLNQKARVYDEDNTKGYGFKQLWRDLWMR